MATTSFLTIFGQAASSARIKSYLEEVISASDIESLDPDVKSYPDAVYFNYYLVGLSLLFIPAEAYKPSIPLDHNSLLLDSVDLFNTVKGATSSRSSTYSQYPVLPLALAMPHSESGRPSTFELAADTTGKELVQAFGEPTRKGGGAGPSSGSIGIWCEWKKLGIMVEFGGDEARGPQAWERGKDAVWKVVTLFKPRHA